MRVQRPGAGENRMERHQPPTLTALDGSGMSADDAAWASIADAAQRALTLPGLSAACAAKLARVMAAGDRAAGLPPRPLPQDRRPLASSA